MPRRKAPAPSRLGEGEREASTWNMGESSQSGAQPQQDAPEGQGGQGSQFSLIIDDDTEGENDDLGPISLSSEDEDYAPPVARKKAPPKKPPAARSKKNKPVKPVREKDLELEGLLESSVYYAEVKDKLVKDENDFEAVIGKIELQIDFDRYEVSRMQIPTRDKFWIYISQVPSRSFLYFEWFDQKEGESDKDYKRREQAKVPNEVHYFYIKDVDVEDSQILDAYSHHIGQKSIQLKFHRYHELSGAVEIQVCLTAENLATLHHPSDVFNVTVQGKRALQHCFSIDSIDSYDKESNLNHDIDRLYTIVKKHHDQQREERNSRVQLNPQHHCLIPKLRPYQADAVRWMLDKEHYKRNLDEDLYDEEEKLHPLFKEVKCLDGTILYFNIYGGFVVKDKPLARPSAPGGILADEMGLGKTVEVLACMLNNPRPNVDKPEYLEPVFIENKSKKRKSKRIREKSPTEFIFNDDKENTGDRIDSDIIRSTLTSNKGGASNEVNIEESIDLSQVDGGFSGLDSDSSADEMADDDNDQDFTPPATSSRPSRVSRGVGARPDRATRKANTSLRRKFSEKRTVYYHEDFDSESSSEDERALATRKKTPNKKENSKKRKKGDDSKDSVKKKAKLIKTNEPASDDKFPVYEPYRNGKVPEKDTKNYRDMLVKALSTLGTDPKNRDGVSINSIKTYVKQEFQKDISNIKLKPKFSEAMNAGVEAKQFIRTTNLSSRGLNGSFVLNPHFDPNDTRLYPSGNTDNLSSVETVINSVQTERCYEGKPKEPVHIPKRFHPSKLEKKKKGNSGVLYNKLKSMYEKELPMSLAFYASYKGNKDWNKTFFQTKVDQQSYFECICGGTEEDKNGVVGYRVQCKDCGNEQHADCVSYDLEDPYRGEYICPHCWVQADRVKSGATLIVSPAAICFQWIEEIQKHIKHRGIKMFHYKGSKEMGYVQPRVLAAYDIVITTYETLSAETNYVDLPHTNSSEGRRFRNPKRFMAMPSPFTCVEWWRICLDEAQMIESTTAKTAEMALRLRGVNKWCVTGTPIGKSVNDLHGLLLFLQVDPYRVETWWKKCILDPFCHGDKEPLEKLLCEIIWRTCKKDVLNQIDIPGQSEEVHRLQFSPVEEHFYRRQHIDVTKDMLTKLKKFDSNLKLSSLDRQTMSNLLYPLLRLRQSCCHPQAVRGQFVNLQKNTMTMEQLLEQLIKKVTNEAEEFHRLYVAALNGLAGIDIIEHKYADAADKYREVLTSVEEHEGKVKTDTLQKLHTVANLTELLAAGHQGIGNTMRDTELPDLAKQYKEKYMKKYLVGVDAAKSAVQPVSEVVEQMYKSLTSSSDKIWYIQVINTVEEAEQERSLLKIVHDELAQFFDIADEKEFREIQDKYPNSRIVMYKISEKLGEVDKWRDSMVGEIKQLVNSDPEQFLNQAVDCHLRLSQLGKKNKNSCKLCQVRDNIDLYENILFRFVRGEIKGGKGPNRASLTGDERKQLEQSGIILLEEQRRGTWSDSEGERLCVAVQKYAKTKLHSSNPDILEGASNQLKQLENMKKEFRLSRVLLRQIFDLVAGVDELNMSTLRLRLRYEDEPQVSENSLKRKDLATRQREKLETIYILEEHELEQQRLKLVAEKATSKGDRQKKLGQLHYLNNLQGTEYGKKGGHNPEPCPICQKELGFSWSVLQCGHCYCVECIRLLLNEYSYGRGTKCAVCRSYTNRAEISYVSTKVDENDSQALEEVKGSHSTKVEAVVRALKRINTENENSKSLVFSTWTDVLDIIGDALDDNDIPYASLGNTNQSNFKRNIQKFKNREDVRVLLLPISRGANGLNLVEANHVLLVEPILNPAEELQAIGRIHRIGQKKTTVVHRFLVRQTIEERIHQVLNMFHKDLINPEEGGHSTEENLLTIKDIRQLFNDDLDTEDNGEAVNIDDDGAAANRDAATDGAGGHTAAVEAGDVTASNNEAAVDAATNHFAADVSQEAADARQEAANPVQDGEAVVINSDDNETNDDDASITTITREGGASYVIDSD